MFEICKCGSTEFYMLQRVSGFCNFYVDINGEPTLNNGDMHDGLYYKDMRKYYRCSDCNKVAREIYDEIEEL